MTCSLRWLAPIVTTLLLWLPAGAQQVYVRNHPFSGVVVNEGGQLWVELEPLQRELSFQAQLEADGARIDGRLVRTLRRGNQVLVLLSQVASALGAVVKENPAFGTVDVHLAVKERAGQGLEDVDTSEVGKADSAVPGEPVKTAAFGFAVPEGMQVSRDPRVIRSFLQGGGPRMNANIKVDAIVFYKGDLTFKRGAAVFTWFAFTTVPKELNDENSLLAFQYQVNATLMNDMHVELVDNPSVLDNEGQKFVLAAGVRRAPPHNGMMVLTRIDAKRGRNYQVISTNIPQGEDKPTRDYLQLMQTVSTR